MSLNHTTTNEVIIGSSLSLLKVDLNKPQILSHFDYQGSLSHINHQSKFLTLGKTQGTIDLFDPKSNEIIKSFIGHNGFLADLDVLGNYIAACGYSTRPRRHQYNSNNTTSINMNTTNNNNNINANNINNINSGNNIYNGTDQGLGGSIYPMRVSSIYPSKTVSSSMLGQMSYSNNTMGLNGGNFAANDVIVDPLINIFDVRMMRSLAPIPFPFGANWVKFHPKLPNILVVASSSGEIEFVDMYDQLNIHLYQADLGRLATTPSSTVEEFTPSSLSNLQISSNGEFIAFNDSKATVHLWSQGNNTTTDFVNFPSAVIQPNMVMPSSFNSVSIESDDPLLAVGMPYYKDSLLSNFASDLTFTKEMAKLPAAIDDELVEEFQNHQQLSLSSVGPFISYDKSIYGSPYLASKYERGHLKDGLAAPKFISGTSVDGKGGAGAGAGAVGRGIKGNLEEEVFQYKPEETSKTSPTPLVAPSCYNRLEIKYSKFGVEDFDFNYYNLSGYNRLSGLENHLDNSYINPLLQLYRYSPAFYNLVTGSLLSEWLPNSNGFITTNNPQGSSVLLEMGYLFDMMYKAQGKNVRVTNFSQVLLENHMFTQQGLLNANEGKNLSSWQLRNLIINFNKFLLLQLQEDHLNQHPGLNLPLDIFGIQYEIEIKGYGGDCNVYDKIYNTQLSLDLMTPPPNNNGIPNKKFMPLGNMLPKYGSTVSTAAVATSVASLPTSSGFTLASRKNHNLLTYLEYTLNQHRSIPCRVHNLIHEIEMKSSVAKLPPLLCINLDMDNKEMKLIHGFKKWLVPEFYVNYSTTNKRIHLKPMVTQFNQDNIKYELLGYVCEIHRSDGSGSNLVSFVKVNEKWFLFNDFLVIPIPDEEVFNLTYRWKRPTIVVYHNTENNQMSSQFNHLTSQCKFDDSILYRDHFAGTIRESYKKEYELLTRSEAPTFGSLVAIDAEFVMLKPEKLEVKCNGSKQLIRPKLTSLARVSVLRGDNVEKQGVPFIDDYVVHKTKIYNYLTNFSGIEENDLDLIKSLKNLVTLQTAYRRLWLLLNMGCVFVGHGLYNDFRTINLQVPSSQIKDTAEFFYLSEYKRRLGLKFLAYVLLQEKVQTGNHDSIEDARTALMLYKKYLELVGTGTLESTLNRIYMEGQHLRFKVPDQ